MASIKQSAIRLVLKARDALSRPVSQSASSLEKLREEARQLKTRLSDLQQQDKLLSSFKAQTQAVRDAGKAYREAEEKVEQLAREYGNADKPSRQMQQSLEAARKSVIAANQSYQKQREKLSQLRSGLKDAGLSNRNLTAQQNKLQKELKQTSTAFETLNSRVKSTARNIKNQSFSKLSKDADRASGSLQRLSGRFAALVGATVGLYGLKRAMTGILNTGDQFERLRVQLNAVMGSVEQGEAAVQWIKQFTRDTPYQLEQVAESFVRLKAFGLDPMDGTMQAIVDQASKLGGGMERLNGITLAVGQAWAKQKLQGEEILQLVERGVPVWSLLEKATGKNVQELQKLSTAGKLGQETIKLLIDEIGKSASGAAAENMSLLSGYVSNLKDSWQNFLDEIAQSGALDYAKAQLKAISEQIARMGEDGRLSRLAQSISDAFVQMGEAIKANFAGITFDEVVARVKGASDSISATLSGLNQTFTLTGNSLKLFFNGFTISVKAFGLAVSSVFSQIASGAGELFSFVNADELAAKTALIQKSLQAASKGYAAQIKQDADDIQAAFKGIIEGFSDSNQKAQQTIRAESQKTADTVATDQSQLQENLTATQQAMTGLKEETGETAKETEKLGKATKEAASKQEEIGKATESVTETLASYYSNVTSELAQMSSAAVQAFESMQGVDQSTTDKAQDDIATLKDQLEAAQAEAQRLSETISADPTGIDSWLIKTGANAAYIKAQFLEQKIALMELMDAYEQGKVSMEAFVSQGKTVASTMNLLDQQSLDQLNRSIEQAEAGMERLADSSRSTLENLQNELDRLQGKNEQIEQRQYQARQRQLQTELEEAKTSGDSTAQQNLQKALSLNSQIYDERRRQSAQQKREERKAQPAIQAPQQPPRQKTTPDKVIRLDYPGGNINVGINPRDETKLLDMLKYTGMRSI
ncbi:tape measure protein [Endozoicomonas sp. Mp262]|uniref:tape measure protein n=1 Tax=Endozoicomonas sp. Mp262 TaxID=2919499 RepID=UPI0021DAF247